MDGSPADVEEKDIPVGTTEEETDELMDYSYYKPYPEATYELKYHVLDDGTVCIDGCYGRYGGSLFCQAK